MAFHPSRPLLACAQDDGVWLLDAAAGKMLAHLRLGSCGGAAFTVEDPPELPLNGFHGQGYCTQTWVAGDGTAGERFAIEQAGAVLSPPYELQALRGALGSTMGNSLLRCSRRTVIASAAEA